MNSIAPKKMRKSTMEAESTDRKSALNPSPLKSANSPVPAVVYDGVSSGGLGCIRREQSKQVLTQQPLYGFKTVPGWKPDLYARFVPVPADGHRIAGSAQCY